VPLLLLSGEDGEGVGKQEEDAGRCWRLLSGGGCCCGDAGLQLGVGGLLLKKCILRITLKLLCPCAVNVAGHYEKKTFELHKMGSFQSFKWPHFVILRDDFTISPTFTAQHRNLLWLK
jgi:hypothetical protein